VLLRQRELAAAASRVICVDFDGTLTNRTRPYEPGPAQEDGITPGAATAIRRMKAAGFSVVVLTARPPGEVWSWLARHDLMTTVDNVTNTKPPALAYVDDRGVEFDGSWARVLGRIDDLLRSGQPLPQVGNDWLSSAAAANPIHAESYFSECPRDDNGWCLPSTGSKHDTGVRIQPTTQRAFKGKTVDTKTKLSKQGVGKLAESIVIELLRAGGSKDAEPMNLDQSNFPVDLVHDHEIIEVKGGQVSNSEKSHHWRLTIGEPGEKEKAWLAKASDAQKAKWNERKQELIHQRKAKVLGMVTKALGRKVRASTMTVIINPDTGIADVYKFDGWHNRIGWHSGQAKSGYLGSVKYRQQ
jgi:hypothetical protein